VGVVVAAKGDKHRSYRIHGDGIDSLVVGFNEINMPDSRRAEALTIVREVLEANHAGLLRWYKTEHTDELACYWDDSEVNTLWINPGELHVARGTPLPERNLTWQNGDGTYLGWLLPEGVTGGGSGGGDRRHQVKYVVCPRSFQQVPAESLCPDCEVVHG
jgi:hypothetical protein